MLIYHSEVCADLEGPEVRVDREDVDQLEGGEDVGGGKQTLRELGEREIWRCASPRISVWGPRCPTSPSAGSWC